MFCRYDVGPDIQLSYWLYQKISSTWRFIIVSLAVSVYFMLLSQLFQMESCFQVYTNSLLASLNSRAAVSDTHDGVYSLGNVYSKASRTLRSSIVWSPALCLKLSC